jgi:hypothetical protein
MKPGGHLTLRRAVSLAALTLVLTLALGPGTAYAQFCPSPFEEEAIARINQERQGLGLDPVETDLRLVEASRLHSQDMATNDFFDHTGSGGSTFSERIAATGYPSPRSENIAAGYATPAAVVNGWMNSDGHRANILDPAARHVGVGWAYDASSFYGVYWTNNFGSSGSAPLGPLACSMPPMVTGDLDGMGGAEAIFGLEGTGGGIWARENDANWVQLHPSRPETMVTGDLDHDGRDEVVADFGPPYGVYAWFRDSGWLQIHHASPEIMATADLDGDGDDEIVIDFGDPYGIYAWFHDSGWLQIHDASARTMITANLDGDGDDEVVIDFGDPYGIYAWFHDSGWLQIHRASPEIRATADLDGDGDDEIVIDFGDPYGIYAWFHGSGWLQIHHASAEIMAGADLDGDSDDELIVDFGHPFGTYALFQGSGWVAIHGYTPEALGAGDLDGNGQDEILIDFGNPYGVWIWKNHTGWEHLLAVSP